MANTIETHDDRSIDGLRLGREHFLAGALPLATALSQLETVQQATVEKRATLMHI